MRPFRTVLLWQLIAIGALALLAAIAWGKDGALSAALGGTVNAVAGWAYGWMVSRRKTGTAGEALRTLFRAEAVKVTVIVLLLWLGADVLPSHRARGVLRKLRGDGVDFRGCDCRARQRRL